MALQDLRSKRSKLMTDAALLIQGKDVTTEQRNTFDRMMAEVDLIEADIAREERIAKFAAEQRATTVPVAYPPASGNTTERSETETWAFVNYLRTGQIDRTVLAEQRDLGAGAISGPITGGSVLVPTGMYPSIINARKSYGAVLQVCDNLRTDDGNPIRVPFSNDVTAGISLLSEATTAPELDPAVTAITSACDFYTTSISRLSLSLLSQSSFNLTAWMEQNFLQRYYRGLSQWVTQGNGSNVASLQASAAVGAVTSTNAGITYTDLADLYGALDATWDSPDSCFLMHSTTRAALMSLVSTTGAPILQTDVHGNAFSSLFGRQIVLSQFSDQIAPGKTPILWGSPKDAYCVREAGGISISVMREVYLPQGEIGVVGFGLVGGFSKNAGVPPLVGLQIHS